MDIYIGRWRRRRRRRWFRSRVREHERKGEGEQLGGTINNTLQRAFYLLSLFSLACALSLPPASFHTLRTPFHPSLCLLFSLTLRWHCSHCHFPLRTHGIARMRPRDAAVIQIEKSFEKERGAVETTKIRGELQLPRWIWAGPYNQKSFSQFPRMLPRAGTYPFDPTNICTRSSRIIESAPVLFTPRSPKPSNFIFYLSLEETAKLIESRERKFECLVILSFRYSSTLFFPLPLRFSILLPTAHVSTLRNLFRKGNSHSRRIATAPIELQIGNWNLIVESYFATLIRSSETLAYSRGICRRTN